jgi:hypothetical protein
MSTETAREYVDAACQEAREIAAREFRRDGRTVDVGLLVALRLNGGEGPSMSELLERYGRQLAKVACAVTACEKAFAELERLAGTAAAVKSAPGQDMQKLLAGKRTA